jgi:hypothetical protein
MNFVSKSVIDCCSIFFVTLYSKEETSSSKIAMSHFTSFPSGVTLTPSSSASTLIKDGWFAETEAMWPGQKFCIQVEEVLLNGRSDFQDILVFKSSTYGTVLAR